MGLESSFLRPPNMDPKVNAGGDKTPVHVPKDIDDGRKWRPLEESKIQKKR